MSFTRRFMQNLEPKVFQFRQTISGLHLLLCNTICRSVPSIDISNQSVKLSFFNRISTKFMKHKCTRANAKNKIVAVVGLLLLAACSAKTLYQPDPEPGLG